MRGSGLSSAYNERSGHYASHWGIHLSRFRLSLLSIQVPKCFCILTKIPLYEHTISITIVQLPVSEVEGAMRLNQFFFTIILCLSAGACYAQIQDRHPPFPICGGVSCEECVPLERQTAPGIGLDISFSHGTAAVEFHNGTICDIILVQGNSMYQAAMKDLALEAKLLREGHQGKLPAIGPSWDSEIIAQPVMQKLLLLPSFQFNCPPTPARTRPSSQRSI